MVQKYALSLAERAAIEVFPWQLAPSRGPGYDAVL